VLYDSIKQINSKSPKAVEYKDVGKNKQEFLWFKLGLDAIFRRILQKKIRSNELKRMKLDADF